MTSSSETSVGAWFSSTMVPSESITRYVGIAGIVDGREKDISVVNLLSTAPGNRTLSAAKSESDVILEKTCSHRSGEIDLLV